MYETAGTKSSYFVPDYVSQVLKYKESGRVLDIGCGTGDASLYFAERGFEVDAIDLKQDRIETLKERAEQAGLKINARVADMAQLKVEPEKYDIVTAINSVYFLPHIGMLALIRTVQDSTKRGGFNAVSVWSDENKEHEARNAAGRYLLPNLYSSWDIKQRWRPENAGGQIFYAITAAKL